MKLSIRIETAIKSILKNKQRSFLTVIGIIIGIAAVITIVSVGRGYEKYSVKQILDSDDLKNNTTTIIFSPSDTSVNNTNLENYNEHDLELVKTVTGVSNVQYEVENPNKMYRDKEVVTGSNSENKKIYLVNEDGKEVIYGEKLMLSDIGNKAVVISDRLSKQAFSNIDNMNAVIGRSIEIAGETFVIKGIYAGDVSESSQIEMNKETYFDYFRGSDKKNIQITVPSQYNISQIADKVVNLLSNDGSMKDFGRYTYSNTTALTEVLSSTLKTLTIIISFIGGISLFISGVGIMNMVYTSISERTKEIGIRRALGATEKAIQAQFLLEGLLLTLFGGILGYILGVIFAFMISLIMGFEFVLDWYVAFLAVAMSIIVGLVFSYFPSKKASEKDVVELVR